eukprot:TRINITY_DN29834_c0_g1_i1.p1 TRINITY_DN29834_c0_g1~~TRINITY_DN29834_c0_g1_i1.p1  ORF type:complete len:379 (+),score=68.12 TRINITY_DN29834_c0_g1_i1:26-1138(+)
MADAAAAPCSPAGLAASERQLEAWLEARREAVLQQTRALALGRSRAASEMRSARSSLRHCEAVAERFRSQAATMEKRVAQEEAKQAREFERFQSTLRRLRQQNFNLQEAWLKQAEQVGVARGRFNHASLAEDLVKDMSTEFREASKLLETAEQIPVSIWQDVQRLADENAKLLRDNDILKARVTEVEAERDSLAKAAATTQTPKSEIASKLSYGDDSSWKTKIRLRPPALSAALETGTTATPSSSTQVTPTADAGIAPTSADGAGGPARVGSPHCFPTEPVVALGHTCPPSACQSAGTHFSGRQGQFWTAGLKFPSRARRHSDGASEGAAAPAKDEKMEDTCHRPADAREAAEGSGKSDTKEGLATSANE